jgi:hypothetical protein
LNPVYAKKDIAMMKEFSDRREIDPVTGDEMAGGKRDQARVFINLALNVHQTNLSEFANVEEPDLNTFLRESHPRVDIGRIVVEINDDVFVFPEGQSAGDIA